MNKKKLKVKILKMIKKLWKFTKMKMDKSTFMITMKKMKAKF